MEDVCIAAPRPLRLFTPAVVHRPRPRIISAPVEAFARFSLSDEPGPSANDVIRTTASPQSNSPLLASANEISIAPASDSSVARLALPEETLEEFLAILRPPILSPPLRVPRRHHSTSVYERPHPYHRIGRKSTSSSSTTTATTDDTKSRRGVGRVNTRERSETDTPITTALEEHDWVNFELGSPISRTHTRNPLPRHPSYEALTSNLLFTAQFSPPLRPSNNPVETASLKALHSLDTVEPDVAP